MIAARLRWRTLQLPLERAVECRFRAIAHSRGDFRKAVLGFVSIYARLGEKDEAVRYLETACRQHSRRLIWLRARATWDPLRSDARLQAVLRRMNFSE